MDHTEHDHHHKAAHGTPEELAECPVMHIPVNKKEAEAKGLVRTYKNKNYYLCCKTCAAQFDANPNEYA